MQPLMREGPYGAVALQAMTAKSLTGLVTDLEGRLLTEDGAVIQGVYAAGELAGFGHPYGDDSPMDSTMVAGAILTGRLAGKTAARDLSN